MTDLVTGEAVVLELRLARLASRAVALGIDLAVQFSLLLLATWAAAGIGAVVDDALAGAVSLVLVVAVVVGYPVAMETLTRGRSLGKLALGLRVVRDDGGPIRFRHALLRGLLACFADIWVSLGSVALISSLASRQGKRVGDMVAGTLVVRERVPARAGPVPVMPPQLAGWARDLDLTGLPDELALTARRFLARAGDLRPDVREAMGRTLAADVARLVGRAIPPGVSATAYLTAVLAERRQREIARLTAKGAAVTGPPMTLGAPTPGHGAGIPAYGARTPPDVVSVPAAEADPSAGPIPPRPAAGPADRDNPFTPPA